MGVLECREEPMKFPMPLRLLLALTVAFGPSCGGGGGGGAGRPPAAGPGALQFTTATYSGSEGVASTLITVSRTAGSTGAVSVTYSMSDGTAVDGADYTASTATLSFSCGMLLRSL
jgi:hypothetical protein